MKRRDFLKTTVTGAAVAAVSKAFRQRKIVF
jgi:TAT (twin-arginine translocation) pathway signal sequence